MAWSRALRATEGVDSTVGTSPVGTGQHEFHTPLQKGRFAQVLRFRDRAQPSLCLRWHPCRNEFIRAHSTNCLTTAAGRRSCVPIDLAHKLTPLDSQCPLPTALPAQKKAVNSSPSTKSRPKREKNSSSGVLGQDLERDCSGREQLLSHIRSDQPSQDPAAGHRAVDHQRLSSRLNNQTSTGIGRSASAASLYIPGVCVPDR